MNKELNEAMKSKNQALYKKVIKKNEIISDEKEYEKTVKKCALDGVTFVTSIGVVTISAYLSQKYNENFALAIGPGTLLGITGVMRFLQNAETAIGYELDLPVKREELYNIENELNNADKKVKKLTVAK